MTRVLIALAASCCVYSASALAGRATDQAPVKRTVYASVTEKSGKPVVDMQTADFEVKEGGKLQEIEVQLATAPLRVALLVSDHGSGAFQGGALRFCEALLGHASLSVTSLIIQPELLMDFSTSGDALRAALLQLGRRSALSAAGAQLTEAIYQTANTIRKEGTRSAIVAIRAGNEASASVRIDILQNAIRKSGAVFYVVSGTTQDYQTMRVSEVQTVLNDSSRESGGRRIDIVSGTLVPTMQQVAAELVNQYEITYTLPAGTKPSDRISVSTKRRGLTVNAPTRIAN